MVTVAKPGAVVEMEALSWVVTLDSERLFTTIWYRPGDAIVVVKL